MQHGLRENPGNAPCRGLQPALLGSLCLSAPWEQSTDGLPSCIHVIHPSAAPAKGNTGHEEIRHLCPAPLDQIQLDPDDQQGPPQFGHSL